MYTDVHYLHRERDGRQQLVFAASSKTLSIGSRWYASPVRPCRAGGEAQALLLIVVTSSSTHFSHLPPPRHTSFPTIGA